MPIPLKFYRCLVHGLKMCILFGYNPQNIFVIFFNKMNLVIFAVKVNRYCILCIDSSYIQSQT